VNRGPPPRLGVDGKTSLDEFEPLLHAVETKASGLHCRLEVKPQAAIADREMNLLHSSPQMRIELLHPAMFHRIVQGLLQHTEEAKGNVWRYVVGQVVAPVVDLHLPPLAELFTETFHHPRNLKIFQSRTVQLVAETLTSVNIPECCFSTTSMRLGMSATELGKSALSCLISIANKAKR
jgi:hypothetical protein